MKKYILAYRAVLLVLVVISVLGVIVSSGCLKNKQTGGTDPVAEPTVTSVPSYSTANTPDMSKQLIATPGSTVPPEVPAKYRDAYLEKKSWLDKKLAEWRTSSHKPMDFGAYDVFSSDDMFIRSNAEVDIKFLDALEQTNSSIIILYIRPKNYFSQKARYDAIINKIRADGKKLFIGARFDNAPMNFEGYDRELTEYTKNIISVIKPDYYGIVIEPTTMEKKHGFTASDEEWIESVKKISELSKQLSPNTKTAVGGHKQELKFLQLASNIEYVDIIGFNIYDMSGIYSEYSGYLGKGDVVGETIDFANSKGKETWILETWITDIAANKELGAQEFMKPIDAEWVQIIAYYAQKHNMKVIVPFFTGKFVSYTDNPDTLTANLNNNERTPVFFSYKELIQDFKSS